MWLKESSSVWTSDSEDYYGYYRTFFKSYLKEKQITALLKVTISKDFPAVKTNVMERFLVFFVYMCKTYLLLRYEFCILKGVMD